MKSIGAVLFTGLVLTVFYAFPVYSEDFSVGRGKTVSSKDEDQPMDDVAEEWLKRSISPDDYKSATQVKPEVPKPDDPSDPKELFSLAMVFETGKNGQKRDMIEAARLYRLAAQQGYAPAQYKVATFYEEGEGVYRNYDEAARWYGKAADQDYTIAQTALAFMYFEGVKIDQDYPAAAALAELAASRNDPDAQLLLGKMYHYGYGVPQDYKTATFWYVKAAKLGVADAQYRVAVMLVTGQGIKKDLVKAYAWANVATSQGSYEAEELREEISGKLSKGQLEIAQNLSKQYYKVYVASQ
ncbi:MAG: sel1 repeat family protein [Rhodospirillales bacterium]|nr:sel1 repeat family protein [Rhodospirillales bacterium]